MNNLLKKIVRIGATIATGYAVYKIMDSMAEKCASEIIEVENEYNNEIIDVETEEEKKDVKMKRVISHIKLLAEYYGKLTLLGGVYGVASINIWAEPRKIKPRHIRTVNYKITII